MLLGLDFETTWTDSVDPKKCRITEIGAVLIENDGTFLDMMSTLVWDQDYPESPPELVELTGITDQMLRTRGLLVGTALMELHQFMEQADAIVAHNGLAFDKPLYEAECERMQKMPVEKIWVDTKIDLPYPSSIKVRDLIGIAARHEIVNPFQHRAVFDVLTMLKVLGRYDVNEAIKLAQTPLVRCVAQVSYHDREQAKKRGYRWDGDNKIWYKDMRQGHVEIEEQEAPFIIRTIEV